MKSTDTDTSDSEQLTRSPSVISRVDVRRGASWRGLWEVKKLGVTYTVTLTGATDPLREVKKLGVTDTVTLKGATDLTP